MRLEILPDAEAAQAAAAAFLARAARDAATGRGRCVIACSGGRDPWGMFRLLAREALPWEGIHVVQVDERVLPAGDEGRNWKHILENLVGRVPLRATHVHPMPVEMQDLAAAAASYEARLGEIAGRPSVLDVVHLGLGSDAHTASLVPDDPVLGIDDRDVAITQPYEGARRMTLTYPVLNRARCLVWLVTGAAKAGALALLLKGDRSVPAGRVSQARAVVFADRAAVAGER